MVSPSRSCEDPSLALAWSLEQVLSLTLAWSLEQMPSLTLAWSLEQMLS